MNQTILRSILASNVLSNITPKLGSVELKAKKNTPELLLALGIGAGILGAVSLAKAWKEHEDRISPYSEAIRNFKDEQDKRVIDANPEVPAVSSKVRTKALTAMYGHMTGELIRLYLPTVVFGGVSLYSLLSAHGIMKGRQKALVAALTITEQAYSEYRKRVKSKFGESAEESLYFDAQEQVVKKVTTDENGKKKKSKEVHIGLPEKLSTDIYNVMFEKGNRNWEPSRIKNLSFLKAQENWMNQKLTVWGHVLLNDVYDSLGMPRTSYGAIVGWSLHIDGDDFVDFGLSRPINNNVTGVDFVVVPNVNGVVYNAI